MLFRKKYVLLKQESTYNTDPTPVDANAFETKNLSITPYGGSTVQRNLDREVLGNDALINTGPMVNVSFDVELAGSGTAGTAPGFAAALRACGFAETVVAATSVTYDLVSDSFESVAVYFDHDGTRHKVLGCRGTVSLSLQRGQLPTLSFNLTGLYTKPIAASMVTPAPAYFGQAIPVTNTNTPTFTVGGYAAIAESFSADIANQVVHRNVIGSEEVLITDRAPTANMVIEETAIGSHDFYADVESHDGVSTKVFQAVHGTTAGNIVTLDAPAMQLTGITKQESDGVAMLSIPALLIPSSGDDEFSIAFT